MTNREVLTHDGMDRFRALVDAGLLSSEALHSIGEASALRHIDAETILLHDYPIRRRQLLEALSDHYGCPWVEYDERRPVPEELIRGLDPETLCESLWFPLIKEKDTVVIAANDPSDPMVLEQARSLLQEKASRYELRVALADDIAWLIQDYLHAPPERLVGNERTGLAFWRNTMARWRTRLACYRTDFAIARTHFGTLRWGLGLISLGRGLLHMHSGSAYTLFYQLMILVGFILVGTGVFYYFKIKGSIMSPPGPQTLVEVTAATIHFLEDYQFVPKKKRRYSDKQTMLSRLCDLLPNSCVFIQSSPDNKVRSFLAHERSSQAAQRTVLACYRTIYSRARTGLSFIRTGVAFASIGLAMIQYFGVSLLTLLDGFVIVCGALLIVDGIVWYWPVRQEQQEAPDLLRPSEGIADEDRA